MLGRYGDQLAGKVVVDITNPVDPETYAAAHRRGGLRRPGHRRARARGAGSSRPSTPPSPARSSRAQVAGQPLDVFLAGDDEAAKDTVKQLVRDGGLRAVDAGPLALAHHVEALGYLHMAIQGDLGTNYASSVKVLA